MHLDHNSITNTIQEYDKKFHSLIEYVREKSDDKHVVKLDDLRNLNNEVDDKIIGLRT
jgi:hypothetical protein